VVPSNTVLFLKIKEPNTRAAITINSISRFLLSWLSADSLNRWTEYSTEKTWNTEREVKNKSGYSAANSEKVMKT